MSSVGGVLTSLDACRLCVHIICVNVALYFCLSNADLSTNARCPKLDIDHRCIGLRKCSCSSACPYHKKVCVLAGLSFLRLLTCCDV